MAGPSDNSEAALAPAQMSASEKAEQFEQFLEPEELEATEEETDPESDDLSDEDLAEGEEAGEEESEPGAAIAPPPSLNAEEKAKFAQLQPEAQRLLAEAETRRNAQVQEATTKASEAQRTAEARAAAADAQAQVVYAQQLNE